MSVVYKATQSLVYHCNSPNRLQQDSSLTCLVVGRTLSVGASSGPLVFCLMCFRLRGGWSWFCQWWQKGSQQWEKGKPKAQAVFRPLLCIRFLKVSLTKKSHTESPNSRVKEIDSTISWWKGEQRGMQSGMGGICSHFTMYLTVNI